jgi:hypothetical protein
MAARQTLFEPLEEPEDMTHTPQHTILVGLCGPAGSGKDTVRAILENKHDFTGLAFADPIRGMVRELLVANGCSADYMERRDLKETAIPGLGVSYRHLAQTLGTEWARVHFGADFWVRTLATRVAGLRGQGRRLFVVSDVRFANEAGWIRSQGGEVWMVERPGLAPVRAHASECINFRIDQVLRNSGTLADLERTTLDALAGAKRVARAGREVA